MSRKVNSFKTRCRLLLGAVILITFNIAASAAMIDTDDFAVDSGVSSRDNNLTVGHDAGNEWMTGSFASQGIFSFPQSDAFVINSSPFTGDYIAAGINRIRFQMYAVNVVPSDLFIRIIDGANVFSYQFNPIVGMYNNWQTFSVDLAWSYGWSGPSQLDFNTALAGVDQIEIQLSRNTGVFQEYYLDNFQTMNADIGGGGGPSAVPEPSTISMLLFIVMLGLIMRRHLVFPKLAVIDGNQRTI